MEWRRGKVIVEAMTKPDLQQARELDAQDELSAFRERFVIADPELVYLLANSLGRLPRATIERQRQLVEVEWGERLIRGWNEGWIEMPQRIGDKLGQLLGARPGEVLMADSTSVNLFKLVSAALQARPGRHKIITDDLNFPSDLYILQGAVKTAGGQHHLQIVPSQDGIHGPAEDLVAAIDEDTALVTLSHTVFKSSYTYDMAAITAQAHAAGALVLWDLSHSAGAVPVDLQAAGADLAVGCTYKYLCAGPGAPAFLYVRRDLQEELQNPLSGWMGQDRPFDFDLQYTAAPGLRRFLTGTPAILALAGIETGVDLLLEAGMERLRAKAMQQTEYLAELWRTYLEPLGFAWKSPERPEQRGNHVTFGHPEGLRISRALQAEMKVIPDFRRPDNLRYAVAPLYTTYEELYEAVTRLCRVVTERLYEHYPTEAPVVT